MTEILSKVIESLGWNPAGIIKKKHGDSPEITNKEFIQGILQTESVPKLALLLNIGEQTANRIIAKVLIPIFGKRTGGGDTWKLTLLTNAELKICSTCRGCLNHSEFTKDSNSFDMLDSNCKRCKSSKNAIYYSDNKDSYHKPYIEQHRAEYNARNAKRRATKLQATTSWSNLAAIKQIYINCPEGHHVDHIYPLISDWVCGLHVEENLQYLSAEENMRKGNRR